MNKYQLELKRLKPWDEIQAWNSTKEWARGYGFISTAGHGYLIVPKEDSNSDLAKKICEYGFIGDLAYYLEEDCEAREFINQIKI